MNTANLKAYAPKARRDFIAAVSKQAEKYGVTAKAIHPVQTTGDVCVVNGRPFSSKLASRINKLGERVKSLGFEQTMEQVAYSWFNRIIAIRYMELHDYLSHGRRVLSHPEHPTGFQILDECTDLTYGQGGQLPHLNQAKVLELKLDGTKDEELYRELLLAQCHALHQAMPFLFETVDDETELLLPENLTKTDSLLHELVTEIPEADWDNIEIIGWLYQFYISEKKDEVIGKVVKSEDIPAATQLFTPNWIVKYMVQNSLGAQWLATYPDSPLKAQMEYYIEPAEQTDEVNAQLKAITPDSLNPEQLTLIDPACGSGHILVEAYDLFKAIYLERGYRSRDIAQLILEKNIFGLDIDQRAAQLTGFALMMKGRADDRRLFEREVKLNVMALQDCAGFDDNVVSNGINLNEYGLKPGDLKELKRLFEHATMFGSLIQVPSELKDKLQSLKQLSEAATQDMFIYKELENIVTLVEQADLLASQYDAVVANPPYMGSKYQTPVIKKFLKDKYAGYDKDLFSAFIVRDLVFSKPNGAIGVVAPYVWMFISSYERLREMLVDDASLTSLIQLEYNAFEPAMIPVATFSLRCCHIPRFIGSYIDLSEFKGHSNQAPRTLEALEDPYCGWIYRAMPDDFKKIPGSPVAYWVSNAIRLAFENLPQLGDIASPRQGLATTDNGRFCRFWQEVSISEIGFDLPSPAAAQQSRVRWFPLDKGGGFRKWYGNNRDIVNWQNDGAEIKNSIISKYPYLNGNPDFVAKNQAFYFAPGITWGKITSGSFSIRKDSAGFIPSDAGMKLYTESEDAENLLLGLLNSRVAKQILASLSQTINFEQGTIKRIPVWEGESKLELPTRALVRIAKLDWDAYERSWDFLSLPIMTVSTESTPTLESSYTAGNAKISDTIAEMKRLEEENNRLFIYAYGLADELTSDVPIDQITLTVNPAYRYGIKNTEEERNIRFREDSMQELVSYAIGCMMGRYSLDEPGLIYANSGNVDFDADHYIKFSADDDGIVPLTDKEWFSDDAANRIVEFIAVAWNEKHLEANLNFLAANLSPKKGEGSRDTIRRYLCDKFYKDHMQTYKKRPIYWLFSSGKQKAFQCLVYLHRYNEGTLARMRTEYVIPLTAKLSSHIDKLDNDKLASDSAAEIKKLEKEIKRLQKQQTELTEFDEKLKHLADQRIKLDLDDGVKVNYGKFGDLLAEVKAITGRAPE
ncbi:MAG: type II restriction/modification system DNA methylase subunit YeeA [Oleiphilaceae bacterium]|jgi:type II restriction/modification system DNA methylase subunit YeeA